MNPLESVKGWFKRTKDKLPKKPDPKQAAKGKMAQVRDAYSTDPVKKKSDFGKINAARKKREEMAKAASQ
jgi:hypothetical protein